MKRLILLSLLFLNSCCLNQKTFPNSKTIVISVGYHKEVGIEKSKEIMATTIDEYEKQLNLNLVVSNYVEITNEYPKSIDVYSALMNCQAEVRLRVGYNNGDHFSVCIVPNSIQHGGILGVASHFFNTCVSTVGVNFEQTVNTMIHEIGHLLGADHSFSGVMFWRSRWLDRYFILKFSKESRFQIKDFVNNNLH